MMSKLIITALLFTICCSCNIQHKSPEADIKQENITTVDSDDEAMTKAIEKARQTFTVFDTAYKNGHFNTEDFSVKVRFETNNGGEHIWADNITYKNGAYYGVLDEDAVVAKGVKLGDKVKIDPADLSDWLFNDNGVLRGGYTIRVLRNKMPQNEKAQFDSSFQLKIED